MSLQNVGPSVPSPQPPHQQLPLTCMVRHRPSAPARVPVLGIILQQEDKRKSVTSPMMNRDRNRRKGHLTQQQLKWAGSAKEDRKGLSFRARQGDTLRTLFCHKACPLNRPLELRSASAHNCPLQAPCPGFPAFPGPIPTAPN